MIKIILDKWYVLVAFTILGGLLGFITQENKYQSDASLMFKLGREHLYQPEFGNRQPIASTRSDLANAINTETHIMGSADVLRTAIQDVGAKKILADSSLPENAGAELIEQSAVNLLVEKLSIRAIEGTNVLQLSFNHQHPEIARDTLNSIIDAFLRHRKELYGDSSLQLMQRKLAENRFALQIAEENLLNYSTEKNIYSYKDQLNSVTEQLIAADRSRQNISVEKSEIEVQLQLTAERIDATAPNISLYTDTATNSLYDDAKARIFGLQVERNQLRGKYHDNSERVTQLLSEINQLKEFTETQDKFTRRSERKGRNPALDNLVARNTELGSKLDANFGKQKSLADLITSLQQKRSELNSVRADFEKKQSAVDLLKERQSVLLDEVDKAELAIDINNSVRSGARVLQRASLPTTTLGITGLARVKLTALLGLLFAIALLMARSIIKSLDIFPESGGIANKSSAGSSHQSANNDNVVENNDNLVENKIEREFVANKKEISETGDITVLGKIVRARP